MIMTCASLLMGPFPDQHACPACPPAQALCSKVSLPLFLTTPTHVAVRASLEPKFALHIARRRRLPGQPSCRRIKSWKPLTDGLLRCLIKSFGAYHAESVANWGNFMTELKKVRALLPSTSLQRCRLTLVSNVWPSAMTGESDGARFCSIVTLLTYAD